MTCSYSLPQNSAGEFPAEGEFWQFSESYCDLSELDKTTLIQNSTTGAEFYLNKNLSYGDILIISFLMLFLLWGIYNFIWNFVWNQGVKKW